MIIYQVKNLNMEANFVFRKWSGRNILNEFKSINAKFLTFAIETTK